MVGFFSRRKYNVMSMIAVRVGTSEEQEPTVGQPPLFIHSTVVPDLTWGEATSSKSSINTTGLEKVVNGLSYLLACLLDLL